MGLSTLYDDEEPIPPMVSAWTRGWGFVDEGIAGTAPASGVFDQVNTQFFCPIYVPTQTIATRMWWANGTVVAGNVRATIYYDTGNGQPGGLLADTGAVAQAGTDSIQFADLSPDIRLDPGLYWLGIIATSGTATIMRCSPASASWDELLLMQDSASGGTPENPATPSEFSYTRMYVFGFSTNTVT